MQSAIELAAGAMTTRQEAALQARPDAEDDEIPREYATSWLDLEDSVISCSGGSERVEVDETQEIKRASSSQASQSAKSV